MKKAYIIKAPSIHIKKKLKIDYKTLFLYSLLICGVIIGTFIIKSGNNEFIKFIKTIVSNNLSVKAQSNYFTLFCSIFCFSSVFLLYNYIFGLCGVGFFFTSVSSLLYGVYLGFSLSVYYTFYSLDGFFYFLTVNLPANAITAATLIKCCSDSYKMSSDIFFYVLNIKTENKPSIREYSLKYLVYTIPIAIGSLLSTVLFKCVHNLFAFIS